MKYADPKKLYVERKRPFIERDSFSNVDQVGFVTFDQQVRALILAGERVTAWKRSAYDYPDGELNEAIVKPDPTLDVGFDLADASEILRRTSQKVSKGKEKGVSEGKESSVPSSDSEIKSDET